MSSEAPQPLGQRGRRAGSWGKGRGETREDPRGSAGGRKGGQGRGGGGAGHRNAGEGRGQGDAQRESEVQGMKGLEDETRLQA